MKTERVPHWKIKPSWKSIAPMSTALNPTPGPWKVIDGAIVANELNKYGNFIIVEMPSRTGHGVAEEEAANARLIAAAPRLATTAKALLEVIGHVTGIERERREMIAALTEALE